VQRKPHDAVEGAAPTSVSEGGRARLRTGLDAAGYRLALMLGYNKAPGADVGSGRRSRYQPWCVARWCVERLLDLRHLVDLDEGVARAVVRARNQHGVETGLHGHEDRGVGSSGSNWNA